METATCEWKTLHSSAGVSRAVATRFWFMHGLRLEEWGLLAKRIKDDLASNRWPHDAASRRDGCGTIDTS